MGRSMLAHHKRRLIFHVKFNTHHISATELRAAWESAPLPLLHSPPLPSVDGTLFPLPFICMSLISVPPSLKLKYCAWRMQGFWQFSTLVHPTPHGLKGVAAGPWLRPLRKPALLGPVPVCSPSPSVILLFFLNSEALPFARGTWFILITGACRSQKPNMAS